MSPWFQNEDPSSRLNNTPPIGAPKAAVELYYRSGDNSIYRESLLGVLGITAIQGGESFKGPPPKNLYSIYMMCYEHVVGTASGKIQKPEPLNLL